VIQHVYESALVGSLYKYIASKYMFYVFIGSKIFIRYCVASISGVL